MTSSAPTLPQPPNISGLNHIPAPSPESFDAEFGGLLPPGTTIPSSWGYTHYYIFKPSSPPTGRNVILVHGGGTPAIGIAPLAFALAGKGENVVLYDTWGHGLSSTPLAPHTPALYHHQLLELLLHFGWSSAHVLGFSLGGAIAASFTVTHPTAVESLVLVAPAGLWKKSDKSWYDAFIEDGGWGREWLAQRKIIDAIEGLDARPVEGWKERLKNGEIDPVAAQIWQMKNHRGHVASLVGSFRGGIVFDLHETYRELSKSKMETLVVLGGEDEVFPMEMMKRELLESVQWKKGMKVVDRAGHEIVRSHIGKVVEIVEEFWGGEEARK
ncbi:Dihydrolipoyllysine-residue acetyltransferase component of acetoin cleaving system [Lachnellula hyalina]|uniref:Dihydrolipoyllysine-residue acetyltransferase component of acetoin cleaving system n=1 Tax=Lachnellula hyalina TaxID=1316788 RepID=A0A8H8RAE4_9HELO|nr:Dihydrolipoyllysine-residue acetyltransferase component of acetoin cleaving system [Lachnellula hyalina]TVY30503.1 Dihydrolipoyllysine-residue acetyltransferase component of acetoin cleaving system [Lachnellula hyalina]